MSYRTSHHILSYIIPYHVTGTANDTTNPTAKPTKSPTPIGNIKAHLRLLLRSGWDQIVLRRRLVLGRVRRRKPGLVHLKITPGQTTAHTGQSIILHTKQYIIRYTCQVLADLVRYHSMVYLSHSLIENQPTAMPVLHNHTTYLFTYGSVQSLRAIPKNDHIYTNYSIVLSLGGNISCIWIKYARSPAQAAS